MHVIADGSYAHVRQPHGVGGAFGAAGKRLVKLTKAGKRGKGGKHAHFGRQLSTPTASGAVTSEDDEEQLERVSEAPAGRERAAAGGACVVAVLVRVPC